MTVMTTMLRRHGATMVERNGRWVPAHFGSPATEAATCRGRVGLAERSDRATIEVRGAAAAVDEALTELARLGDAAWWVRCSPRHAIVRCDGAAADACSSMLVRAEEVGVADVSGAYAAVDLVGPQAPAVLAAHLEEDHDEHVVVVLVRRDDACVELLAPRAEAPMLWNRLLTTGEPYGIACVGLEALEHLEAADRAGRRRGPGGPAGERPGAPT